MPPLTELALANAMGKVPAQQFFTFDEQPARRLMEALDADARQRMNEALNNAGMALNGIDPFQRVSALDTGVMFDVLSVPRP